MGFKLFVSDYTYRTEEMQMATFAKVPELIGAPVYTPEDLLVVFRPSTRKTSDTLVAASTACFAKTEDSFARMLFMCRAKGTRLEGLEDGFQWRPGQSSAGAIKAWKKARVLHVSRIGSRKAADLKEDATRKAIELIRADWPKSSRDFSTKDLLTRSGLSLNTIKKHLGSRIIAQHNHQAAQKRKAKREAK